MEGRLRGGTAVGAGGCVDDDEEGSHLHLLVGWAGEERQSQLLSTLVQLEFEPHGYFSIVSTTVLRGPWLDSVDARTLPTCIYPVVCKLTLALVKGQL